MDSEIVNGLVMNEEQARAYRDVLSCRRERVTSQMPDNVRAMYENLLDKSKIECELLWELMRNEIDFQHDRQIALMADKFAAEMQQRWGVKQPERSATE